MPSRARFPWTARSLWRFAWTTIQPSLPDEAPPYGRESFRADIFLPTRSDSLPGDPSLAASLLMICLSCLLCHHQVAPEKDRNRIAYLVQHHPEHFSPGPLDLLAGPCQGFPPRDTGPGHEDDPIAEQTREDPIGVAQNRWCIHKRIVEGRSLGVKPKRQLRRTKERFLVCDARRAGRDGQPSAAPRGRGGHFLGSHQLGQVGPARREAGG